MKHNLVKKCYNKH